MIRSFGPLWAPLATLALVSNAWGHRLDEYLQATLVNLEPAKITLQINLTPGVDVVQLVQGLADHNHDGMVSPSEARAYADSLRRDLTLRLDDKECELKLTTVTFPEAAEMREGAGIIQIEFSVALADLAAGSHRLTLENRHLLPVSVYLFNAALPRTRSIAVTAQKRNDTQSTGEIDFAYRPSLL